MALPDHPLSDGKIALLKRLKQAQDDAVIVGKDARQFAVRSAQLLADGATRSDLLWLIKQRFVEHVLDVARNGEPRRGFRAASAQLLYDNSCFVLTHLGAVYIDRYAVARQAAGGRSAVAQSSGERIHWNQIRHELLVDGKLAKRFMHAAPAQWMVLEKLQLEGWRGPVEVEPSGDPKRDRGQRLRELVSELNKGLDQSLIHFRKDCDGNRITYDLA